MTKDSLQFLIGLVDGLTLSVSTPDFLAQAMMVAQVQVELAAELERLRTVESAQPTGD